MRPVCSSRAVRGAAPLAGIEPAHRTSETRVGSVHRGESCHRQESNLAIRLRRPVPSSRRTGAIANVSRCPRLESNQLLSAFNGALAPAQLRGQWRLVPESNRFHSSDSRAAMPIASRGKWGERWESNPRFQGHILACCRNTSSTVGVAGIEPAISSSRTRRDTTSLHSVSSPGRTRTCNRRLNRAPHDHRAAGERSSSGAGIRTPTSAFRAQRASVAPRPNGADDGDRTRLSLPGKQARHRAASSAEARVRGGADAMRCRG